MLDRTDTVLVVVDVQGKLAQLMYQRDILFQNLQTLIKGMRLLDVPMVFLEQVPDKLGPTVPEVRELMLENVPIEKATFSGAASPLVRARLTELKRSKVILAGIEAHVCVYQTAMDLLELGFSVHIVADAVSSRTKANMKLALRRLFQEGAHPTSTEMLLFELQKVAEGDAFRKLVKLVK